MTIAATDFSGYTSDAQPSDWTTQWDSGATFLVKDVVGALGGKVLRFDPGASTTDRQAIKWNSKDDNGSADVTVRLKVASWGNFAGFEILQQGSGTSTTETGYIARLYTDSGGARYIRLLKAVSSTQTSLGILALGSRVPATNADVLFRFSIYGGYLYTKVWDYGTAEPAEWDLSVADSTITASGWTGLLAYSATVTFDVDWIGIEYNRAAAVPTYSPVVFGVSAATTEGDEVSDIELDVSRAVYIDATCSDDVMSLVLETNPCVSLQAVGGDDIADVDVDFFGPWYVSVGAVEQGDSATFLLETTPVYVEAQQTFRLSVEALMDTTVGVEVEQEFYFTTEWEGIAQVSLESLQNIRFGVSAQLVVNEVVELGANFRLVPEVSFYIPETMEVETKVWFATTAEMNQNSEAECEATLWFKPEVAA